MACQAELNDLKYCTEIIKMQAESEFSFFPTNLRVLATCYPFQQKYDSCLASPERKGVIDSSSNKESSKTEP